MEDLATWKSAGKKGGVTVGTLFGVAKQHGFTFPAANDPSVAEPLADAKAEPAGADELDDKADDERRLRCQAKAQRQAADIWAKAAETGVSPYLDRKGVRGHGVRYMADGTLVVPLCDVDGVLRNVQRIAPSKPTDGKPEKRFVRDGAKSGLFHVIGQLDGASVVLFAEGYATAASVHEATGRPAVVCFDAGNLLHVVKELRSTLPAVPFLVCGDDDVDTCARTGRNPGRDKAAHAARLASGGRGTAAAVFPPGAGAGVSDFNDVVLASGIDVVRQTVEQACASLLELAPVCVAPESCQPLDSKQDPDRAPDAEQGPQWDPFFVDDAGVHYVARDNEGNERRPMWLCKPLEVVARTRGDDGNGWGYLLQFTDPDGNAKTWAMPSEMLSGDGGEWAGRLRYMGLIMASGSAKRNRVAEYIETRRPVERVTCTDRVGWHGSVFVLPSGSIGGDDGRRFVFQSEAGMEDTYRRSGTLEDWQRDVAALCAGNSRLVFAVCCAFAGPMLRPAEVESGGVHFRGDSSQGKTTALKVAASVWGRPSYMQRWRTTDNALEATAVQHCDSLLILDEFGQLDPKVAGECAYMLANDQEKGRATRGGLARKRRTWRLLFLSSGEVSLAQHMESVAKTPRAGQEVRMLDIPLDAGAGMGGLETLHQHERPAELAEAVVSHAARAYGTPGRAWLEWVSARLGELQARLPGMLERYRDQLVPEGAAEQVRRAATRFALIAASGELATEAGITGWTAGEALRAARQCFAAWLGARGHIDNGEDVAMLRQVRQFLELNGEGRFTWWHRAADDHAAKTLHRAGFRRLVTADGKPIKSDAEHMRSYGERMSLADSEQAQVDFIVFREVFRKEVCQGFDPEAVARLLKRRGHLVHEADRLTFKHRLPGMAMAPCFHIRPTIFDDDL